MPAAKEGTPFVQWHVSEDFASNAPNPIVIKGKVVVGTESKVHGQAASAVSLTGTQAERRL